MFGLWLRNVEMRQKRRMVG